MILATQVTKKRVISQARSLQQNTCTTDNDSDFTKWLEISLKKVTNRLTLLTGGQWDACNQS